MTSRFQQRIIDAISTDHLSVREISKKISRRDSSVSAAINTMARANPQILHISGADEGLAAPIKPDDFGWDDRGDCRYQLTRHGLGMITPKPRLVSTR